MKLKTFAFGGALVLAIFLFAQRHAPPQEQPLFTRVLDLTHTIDEQAPTFEANEKFTARTVETFEKQGYFAREISLPEHFGTHLDAPAHMARGRWTVDEIPPERLLRPLVILDVRSAVKDNADYRVGVGDIAAWEQEHGHIPAGSVVIARTGWEQRWSSKTAYRNADTKGVMHFPGYSVEAAKFLVEGRDVVGIGIDTLSVDYGPSEDFAVHRYCAEHSLYHLENVANLAQAPPVGALVVVAPVKISGGSGSPARVLALLR